MVVRAVGVMRISYHRVCEHEDDKGRVGYTSPCPMIASLPRLA